VIDYETLVDAYQRSLTSTLRGFRAGDFTEPFLETWVPDEDDSRSLAGIFEAAAVAKVPRLVLRVGGTTHGRLPAGVLDAIAARWGRATTTRDGDAIVLDVALTASAEAPPAAEPSGARGASVSQRRAQAVPGPALPRGHERAALYDTALRAVAPFTHEGSADVAGASHVEWDHEGASLEAWIDARHVIVAARHRGGAGDVAAVLEALCRTIEALPIREAADHGAQRLELALRGRGGARVVPGIVGPANADPRIGACNGILRGLLASYEKVAGPVEVNNEFVRPPGEAWARATPAEREARAKSALRPAARELGLDEEAVDLVEIHGDARVVVAFASDVAAARRPSLLFGIERALKEALDESISVYVQEMADRNRIRRLVAKPAEAR
jgi:hypothetical protein